MVSSIKLTTMKKLNKITKNKIWTVLGMITGLVWCLFGLGVGIITAFADTLEITIPRFEMWAYALIISSLGAVLLGWSFSSFIHYEK
jgi:hypothetical protein